LKKYWKPLPYPTLPTVRTHPKKSRLNQHVMEKLIPNEGEMEKNGIDKKANFQFFFLFFNCVTGS
jgi:hypothetical protein